MVPSVTHKLHKHDLIRDLELPSLVLHSVCICNPRTWDRVGRGEVVADIDRSLEIVVSPR
jgi:hypothetical protein